MSILYHPAAVRELEKLSREVRARIIQALEELHETGRGDLRHIRRGVWSLRVGDYRVYLKRTDGDVLVGAVDHRKHAYVPERVRVSRSGSLRDRKGFRPNIFRTGGIAGFS